MPPEFCREHSEVMRCLGALEEGQRNQTEILSKMDSKISELVKNQNRGNMTAAVEKVKTNLLYWVLGVSGIAAISAGVNFLFNHWGKK